MPETKKLKVVAYCDGASGSDDLASTSTAISTYALVITGSVLLFL